MTGQRKKTFLQAAGVQQLVIVGVLIILFTFFCLMSASFRKYTTLITMASYMYYIMLMAIGVTFPLITGGVDLSIGTGLVCYSIVGSYMMRQLGLPIGVAMAVTVGMGILFGFINGVVVAKLDLPPFITTLCTMMIVRGLGSILTNGMTGAHLPVTTQHVRLRLLNGSGGRLYNFGFGDDRRFRQAHGS